MLVRAYRLADAASVAGLLGELGYPTTTERAATFAQPFVARADAALLVASVDGEVVGVIATCLVPRLDADEISCRITDLVVTGARRRRAQVGRLSLPPKPGRAMRARSASTSPPATGAPTRTRSTSASGFRDNARALTRRL